MKANLISKQVSAKAGALMGPGFVLASILIWVPISHLEAQNRNPAVINAELFMQLEQLQAEVQTLRNQVEQQQRTLDQLQEGQRNRYIDLDERLQEHSKRLNELEEQPQEPSLDSSLAEPLPTQAASSESSSRLSDREAYAKAYQLVPERQFDEAIQAFQAFIREYPDSRLVGNGYYWIGEIYMAQNRTREAEKMFEAVVRRYPNSFKVADSQYKLGLIYARYGNQEQARDTMQSILDNHPREPAAELARRWLDR